MIERDGLGSLGAGGHDTWYGNDDFEGIVADGEAGELAAELNPVAVLDGLQQDGCIKFAVSTLTKAGWIGRVPPIAFRSIREIDV